MKHLNILVMLLCLMLLRCGVASKTQFISDDDRVRFDVAIGSWDYSATPEHNKDITFLEYLKQHRDEAGKRPLLSVHHVKDRDYELVICQTNECDTFSLRFIRRGKIIYASFREIPNGEPHSQFGKVYAPDLYGIAKIDMYAGCVIRVQMIGKRREMPSTINALITEEKLPKNNNRKVTTVPEKLFAETERLNYWADEPFYFINKNKGMCIPVIGTASGVFVSPGVSISSGWGKDGEHSVALGTEFSALYFHGGFAGFGTWTGGYLDVLYDTGTKGIRSSIGPEIGWGPFGIDGGYVLDLAGGKAHHGVQARGLFSISFVQGFARLGYIQGYGTDFGGGMLVKIPFRLTNDSK